MPRSFTRFRALSLATAIALSSSLLLTLTQPASAGTDHTLPSDSKLRTISQSLTVPWAIAALPAPHQNLALVSEKAGQLKLVDLKSGESSEVTGFTGKVRVLGQGGLMDVAVSPHFEQDSTVYFTYSKAVNQHQAATALASARLDVSASALTQFKVLLVTDSAGSKGRHFGSRISFDDSDHLYFSVGDRGERQQAQNLNNQIGTIIRLTLEGDVPSDNPFVGQKDANDAIYSYGHRNPQGLFFDPQRQALYAIEHGPRGGDELNRIVAGANYGWPVVSYGKEYWGPISVGEGTEKAGMQSPLYQYTPSIAPSSLIQCPHSPWPNQLIAGALAQRHLNILSLNKAGDKINSESRYLGNMNERIRDLSCHPTHGLLLITDSGKLLSIH